MKGAADVVASVAFRLLYAWQILNVTVELFYLHEEGAYHDALGFLQCVAFVDLLTFCSIFVKDGLQMESCAGQEMLLCLAMCLVSRSPSNQVC